MTSPPILVTGGTGTLGRQVTSQLQEAGREVRVLSRRAREHGDGLVFVTGDLATGEGVTAAVQGAGTIVHCASSQKGDAVATRSLVRAAREASSETGPPHVVYISIVGVDRFPHMYFKAKLEAEGVITASGLPWTILRATQFYDLILSGAARLAKLPVIPVPAGFVTQPVDSGEVATRLAGLALGEPRGRVPDMAGPQVLGFADLIRMYLSAAGRRHRPMAPPGGTGLDTGYRPHPGRRHVPAARNRGNPGPPDLDRLPGRKASKESDFSHAGTASTAIRVLRVRRNRMNPGFHLALTGWKSTFISYGTSQR